jgi:hypothetical protein
LHLTPERLDHLLSVAAGRYKRTCWWADVAELKAEGALAAVECSRTFDPRVAGTDAERYYWRAIVLRMKNALWHESTPATGGTKHRRKACGSLTRASVSHAEAMTDRELPADEQVADADWCSRVRARLLELADNDADVGILLEETSPAAVAEAEAYPIARVYADVAQLRGLVRADVVLFHLMQEKKALGYSP